MPFRSALFLKIAINSFVKKVVQDLTSGGSDPCIVVTVHDKHRFLSTLPARGATVARPSVVPVPNNFYPRSPRGERPMGLPPQTHYSRFYPRSPRGERLDQVCLFARGKVISIHAPREGSDRPHAHRWTDLHCISIHAPREGSDTQKSTGSGRPFDFYPRSPARGATR